MKDSEIHGKIFDIKKMAVHDGPGIRTTVFFKGCPLRCIWCHNPEGISFLPELGYIGNKCSGCGACAAVCPVGAHNLQDGRHSINRETCVRCFACVDSCMWEALTVYGKDVTVAEVMAEILPDRGFFETSGGGVTLSGGEALAQPNFTAALLKACKHAGVHTCVDTSGAVDWQAFEKALPYTDLFLYDMKLRSNNLHQQYTGMPNRLILENLARLGERGAFVEIRIPVIPDVNDKPEELRAIAELLAGNPAITRVRILPFNELARSKYSTIGMPCTMPEARKQGKDRMLQYGALLEQYGLTVVVAE